MPICTEEQPEYKPSRKAVLSSVTAALEASILGTPAGQLLPPDAAIGESLPPADAYEIKPGKTETPGERAPALPLVSLFGPSVAASAAPRTSLQGLLTSRACVSRREPVRAARDAIAADVRAGVSARLSPAYAAPGPDGEAPPEEAAPLGLARRVFLRLPGSPLTVYETLSFRESPSQGLARLQEVLGSAFVVETLKFDGPMERRYFHPRGVRRQSPNQAQLAIIVYLVIVACGLFVYYWNFVRK